MSSEPSVADRLSAEVDRALNDSPPSGEEIKEDANPSPREEAESEEVREPAPDREEPEGAEDEEKPKKEATEDDPERVERTEAAPRQPSIISKANKEFPGFFKKYPEIKDNFFIAKEYRQVFATIPEAKEAANKADNLDVIGELMVEGDLGPILDSVHEHNPASVEKLARNFLPILNERSPKLFAEVVKPILNNFLAHVNGQAERNGNENLKLAVQHIAHYLTGRGEAPEATPLKPMIRERGEVDAERASIATEREDSFYASIEGSTDPATDAEIERALGNVVKNLPPKLKSTFLRETKLEIYSILKQNPSHMRTMQALYKSARANGYSPAHRGQIARTVMEAVKELIPSVVARNRKELLGDRIQTPPKNNGTDDIPASNGSPADVAGSSRPKVDATRIDWSKTKSLRAAMDGNVVYKK